MRSLGNANDWHKITRGFPPECLIWSHSFPLSARRDGTSVCRAEVQHSSKNRGRAGNEPGDGDRAMAALVFCLLGCGTSDEIRPERAPRAQEPLFVWSTAAAIQSPFAGRYEPDSAFPNSRSKADFPSRADAWRAKPNGPERGHKRLCWEVQATSALPAGGD